MPAHDESGETDRFRLDVMSAALELFESRGFDATTVDQIADRAGISRRTFFRQFRSKDDVVFVDHDVTLAAVRDSLARSELPPYDAVCDAAAQVYERFAGTPDTTRRRYRVVQAVPALRERELVMVLRYEQVFVGTLRDRTPDADPLITVQFAAAVTATHNYLLRRWLRDATAVSAADVRAALAAVRTRFAAPSSSTGPTVAILPPGVRPDDVTAVLTRHFGTVTTTE
ncbi:MULTISPECIES: TetR family transcriptional regulator [Nocardiaceae]|nr:MULTISPECIES: TetR family transcriptional regulator [Rhodococcus]AMY21311.1 Putative mycofactocin biosynthesis transcriptional regulator MftR [Rhodococcus sp. PBTS 1]